MAAGSGTVNILGHPVKKTTALVMGVAAAGVVIVAIMRKRSAAAAAATPGATGMVTDPAGNQCASLDAATGYCPGTPQDIAAQQSAAGAAALGSADEGGLAGGGYYYQPTATGTSSTGSAVPSFTDNGSWAQYVETALGSNGSDAIAAAIAKYLSGQQVTSAQQTTIEESIAVANYPPVAGSQGYPPSIRLTAAAPPPATGTGTGTGTGTSTAAQVTVPNLYGLQSAAASAEAARAGFKVHYSGSGSVASQTPGPGTKAAKGSTIDLGRQEMSAAAAAALRKARS
jgi:hypothetical protein